MEANEPSGKMKQTVYLLPLFVLIAGFLACFSCAALSSAYWDLLALLLIISLASLLVGMVLGFLFGIPRLNKNYDPRDEDDRSTKYQPNTNLEEISDWLTKIIIGVTLTQLTKIPGYLQAIADELLTDRSCLSMNCDLAKPSLIAHDNRFTGRHRMSIAEKAAVNVLLAKGIIAVLRENAPNGKAALSIVDEDILQRFA